MLGRKGAAVTISSNPPVYYEMLPILDFQGLRLTWSLSLSISSMFVAAIPLAAFSVTKISWERRGG